MSENGVNTGRRRFLTAATAVVGAAGVVGVAVPFVGSWNPSKKAKAAGAPVKQDISKLELGQMIVAAWRGKPVYFLYRTKEALASIVKLDSRVSDPESNKSIQPPYAKNEYRSIKPQYLIMLGVCTHLGCAPEYKPVPGSVNKTWIGGFFCPCHGSQYDLAGRVFSGMPAPTNMTIPPHRYLTDTLIEVGVDEEKAS